MSIKQTGGVFGRNPTFNNVTIEGQLTFDGDIDINSDLKIDGELEVTGAILANGGIALEDNDRIKLGDAENLEIYRDPNHSWIKESGSGNLYISSDGYSVNIVKGDNTANVAQFIPDSAVNLFHAGDLKMATSAAGISVTGNIAVDSGNGIDFSATSGTGTSELLDDYEEGTWTPSVSAGAISGTSVTLTGTYTKIGNSVNVFFNANNSAGDIQISSYAFLSGLPFATQRIGTSTVTSEDVEEASRQGFAATTGTILFLGASGSSSGTTNLACSITYQV